MELESNASVVESKLTKAGTKEEKKEKLQQDHDIGVLMVGVLIAHLSACEKMDRMFGSGGEAIVHYMGYESGQSLFSKMKECYPDKSSEELMKAVVDMQRRTGWGKMAVRVVCRDPPSARIVLKGSPIKTTKGSQKHLIGSFWAGVLSCYFKQQLTCTNFSYDSCRDEFSCTIATQ